MDFLIHSSFNDFDQFADAARDWQLEFVQLDRGAADFRLLLAAVDGTQIGRAKFNRKLLQRGLTPPGTRTFVIPVNPGLTLDWLRWKVSGNDLLIFPDNGELMSLSLPDFDVITFSVPVAQLEIVCDQLEIPSTLFDKRQVVRLPQPVMDGLRAHALRCTDALANRPAHELATDAFRSLMVDDLTAHVLNAVDLGVMGGAMPKERRQTACVRSVIDLLQAQGADGVSVAGLCRQMNVSERTLQYAFRDQFDVSPKQFLKAWQLNGVRRALATTGVIKISATANRFGFWHMGQFAADYRKMFGELPSQTVARGSRCS